MSLGFGLKEPKWRCGNNLFLRILVLKLYFLSEKISFLLNYKLEYINFIYGFLTKIV